MWHLYMSEAEKGLPARQFLTPNAYPTFEPFQHGYWGYLAVQTYAAPTTTETTVSTAHVTTADHPAPVPQTRGIR
jgi:hypothetical protein